MAGVPIRMGLREANQHFSAAIRAIKAGRTVLLTDRGRPIALMQPVEGAQDRDQGRTRLEGAGLLRKAVRTGPMPRFRPIRISGASVLHTLRAERDGR